MANLTPFQQRHRAGALRKRVKLQQLRGSTEPDSRGNSQKVMTDIDAIKVGIFTLNGREMELAREIVPTATHLVVARYNPEIKPKARFVFGSRAFNVESVDDPEDRNRWQDSICIEEVLA